MAVFVDTSALYATLSSLDQNHLATVRCWQSLRKSREPLFTTNYVLVETIALLGRRIGLEAVADFHLNLVPLMTVGWIDKEIHDRAISVNLASGVRGLSFVDCVSFEFMRSQSITTAFAFDNHFASQGFDCIP